MLDYIMLHSDVRHIVNVTVNKQKVRAIPFTEFNSHIRRVPLLPCWHSTLHSFAIMSLSLWHLSSEDIKASDRHMLITDRSWNTYEVRNYYNVQFIDEKTELEIY